MQWFKNIKYMVLAYAIGAYVCILQIFNKIFNRERRKLQFNRKDYASKNTTKVAVVTGGTSGIGQAIVNQLTSFGYHVICGLHGQNYLSSTHDTKKDITYKGLDLNSLQSVQLFSDFILKKYQKIDLLINCAGVMFVPYQLNENRIEEHFATNYLGHFLLSKNLLPRLNHFENSHIINVISSTYILSDLKFTLDCINPNARKYSPHLAYAKSKLALLLFSYKLQAYLGEETGINVIAYDPGTVVTQLYKSSWWPTQLFVEKFGRFCMRNSKEAADDILDILSTPHQKNKYYCSLKGGYCHSHSDTYNLHLQDQLWDNSLKLINY